MLRRSLLAFAILVMLPAAAAAGAFTYYGPQLGFSSGPDQFVVGGHLQWNNVAPRLDFAPGVDLGFGNSETLVSLNGDFHYRIATSTTWQPYVGGGVGIHFANASGSTTTGSSDTRAAGHFIVGAMVPAAGRSRFFTELKLGMGDGPDLKALAGWNYRSR